FDPRSRDRDGRAGIDDPLGAPIRCEEGDVRIASADPPESEGRDGQRAAEDEERAPRFAGRGAEPRRGAGQARGAGGRARPGRGGGGWGRAEAWAGGRGRGG